MKKSTASDSSKALRLVSKTVVILSVATIVIPLSVMFLWPFVKGYRWPSLLPKDFGMRGWDYVFRNSHRVLNSLKMSFLTSMGATVTAVIISIPCARVLAFESFRGKKAVETLVFSPVVIPAVSIGMGLNVQFIKMGLYSTLTGVILVMVVPCIPYSVNMIKDVYLIIGDRCEKQALMLGASRWQVFYSVTLPMIIPGVISAAMMCYIVSFSQYFLVYLIGGGKIVTFTMEMFPFIQSGDRMLGSVYGVIFIFSTVFSLIIMEWIIKRVYKKEIEDYKYI